MSNIKNIIIFLGIGAAIFLAYFFFFKGDPDTDNLVSTATIPLPLSASTKGEVADGKDFLTLLLSVRSIVLNDAIFADAAFILLDDTHSIILEGDGNEGRPNPFAPFGSDAIAPPITSDAAATGN